MKKSSYALIILLIFFFLFLVTIFSFFYYEIKKPPSVRINSYLEIDLSGEIQEFSQPDFFTSFFLGTKPLSVFDIWMNIRKAKVDDRIQGLLLRIGYLQCDWAKVNEFREAILDFRTSGKKAVAYIEEAPECDKEYFLATACDSVILHPLGWLGINGIGGYIPFLKKALDKLGIEAEFEHVEEYKTAYNMFTEEGFTPSHRQMLESIYSDIFSHYVKTIAASRNKPEEEVKRLIDHGLYQGENALKAGIVDDLLYEDELESLFKDKEKKLHKIRLSEYGKVKPTALGLDKGKKIALIYGMGPIHTGESFYQTIGSRTVSRWIRKAREDKSIAAIVFRVDSPGGSAVASDVIWREVFLAKKEKPFIVSMSDMAGSGGYWISMTAHKIVAQPQTLTGSIGVLAGKFNLARFYEKLGITSEKLTYGDKADLFTTFRGLTPEEKKLLKDEILWTYDRFLSKVAEGRNMTKEDVDKVGKGRVWTGSQAKEVNLVDEMGGLTQAIEQAKKLAGIPAEEEVQLAVWPKRVSLFGALFGKKEATLPSRMNQKWNKALEAIRLFEREKAWAIMPLVLLPSD